MSEQNGSSGPQALAQRGAQLHEGLRALLQKSLPRLNEIASTVLKPERLIRAVLGAASRTPELLECTPASIMQCVMISAQLGLEPNTPLGHFYLVPFKNRKTGKKEATPIIGYRGLVDLARRGGQVATIEAHIVHENDPHEVKFGRELKLWHTPCLKGDAGKPLFGYAVATMKDGAVQAEVMTWAEIMKIRDRSKARENGPWGRRRSFAGSRSGSRSPPSSRSLSRPRRMRSGPRYPTSSRSSSRPPRTPRAPAPRRSRSR